MRRAGGHSDGEHGTGRGCRSARLAGRDDLEWSASARAAQGAAEAPPCPTRSISPCFALTDERRERRWALIAKERCASRRQPV